jgi:hypothetical protein
MSFTPGSSTADMMRQLMFSKMNQDGTEESFAKVSLVWFATDSAVRIQGSAGQAADKLVNTLVGLGTQGYDKDTEVAKNQVKVNDKINDVLVKLAEAAARHAS